MSNLYGTTPAAAGQTAFPSYTYPSMGTSSVYGDPSMLAFIRSSGMANEIAASDVARKTATLNQALGIATQDLAAQGEDARRNIAGSMEARGFHRSGQHLLENQRQEAAQARRLGGLRLTTADQIADLQSGPLARIAGNQQRAAELALNTGMNQDTQAGLAALGGL